MPVAWGSSSPNTSAKIKRPTFAGLFILAEHIGLEPDRAIVQVK